MNTENKLAIDQHEQTKRAVNRREIEVNGKTVVLEGTMLSLIEQDLVELYIVDSSVPKVKMSEKARSSEHGRYGAAVWVADRKQFRSLDEVKVCQTYTFFDGKDQSVPYIHALIERKGVEAKFYPEWPTAHVQFAERVVELLENNPSIKRGLLHEPEWGTSFRLDPWAFVQEEHWPEELIGVIAKFNGPFDVLEARTTKV